MKTFPHLWLDDKGLKAFNAPEYPKSDKITFDYKATQWYKETGGYLSINEWYDKALQQALDEGVYFKDLESLKPLSRGLPFILTMEKHKVYPVPDGYEVELKPDDGEWRAGEVYQVYAFLVPKKKTGFEENIKGVDRLLSTIEKRLEEVKQQSIEEAAEVSWDEDAKTRKPHPCNPYAYKVGFIAGAKSQAAKEYWYQQFKREQQ